MPEEDTFPFPSGTPAMARDAVLLSQTLRRFLNGSAALKGGSGLVEALVQDLNSWSKRLEGSAASEDESLWRKCRRNQPPALLPTLSFTIDEDQLSGNVSFGRFHVGRGAAHGGAIAMVFDEVMGALAVSRRRAKTRTAYLHVDYRALTPIDTELTIRAWIDAVDGRKRLLGACISNGEVVCAEAHGLWIEVRPTVP